MKLSLFSSSPVLAILASLAVVGCQAATDEETGAGAGAVVESEGKSVMSQDPSRLIDVPFYFSVPKSAVADSVTLNRAGYSYPTLWNSSTELETAGLRIIAINQKLPKAQLLPPASADADVIAAAKKPIATANRAAKKAARDDMSRQLAAAGVIQDGDIVLSFRPENAATVPYMHVQMGTTHASLAYVQGGLAKNVDAPMKDSEYVGAFNTLHFTGGVSDTGSADLGTDALHILRPRALAESPARRKSLNFWAAKTATNRAGGHVAFNSEYLAPSAPTKAEARKLATDLGRHILGLSAPELKIFCSEFAWHMLALSNCSEADIRAAGPDGAQCAEDGIVFEQMPLIGGETTLGLGEGPLAALLGAPQDQRASLVTTLFKSMERRADVRRPQGDRRRDRWPDEPAEPLVQRPRRRPRRAVCRADRRWHQGRQRRGEAELLADRVHRTGDARQGRLPHRLRRDRRVRRQRRRVRQGEGAREGADALRRGQKT